MLVEVRSRVPGRDRDEMPVARVEADAATTVAQLIDRAVAEQVRLLAEDRARGRRVLDRQYLTPEDVAAQAPTGVVRLPAPPAAGRAAPDAAAEAERARRAFERGAFVVFAGGRRLERLDERVEVGAGEPILFLRLVPLVGG
ncbi:hypothetical protein [Dactylosporangium sp. CA-233914]|uniref:hypothetical protein n=1 Tax=Dactylosporangium sp. CA-233914 TaxID=3239934 RepID=UPI003D8DFFA7